MIVFDFVIVLVVLVAVVFGAALAWRWLQSLPRPEGDDASPPRRSIVPLLVALLLAALFAVFVLVVVLAVALLNVRHS